MTKRLIMLFILLSIMMLPACDGIGGDGLLGSAGELGSGDRLSFMEDITIPDGTVVEPGQAFTKTWLLRNSGSTTWTEDYDLVFYGGHHMGGPLDLPLTKTVAPGETIALSVKLIAPVEYGGYTGYWMLRSSSGQVFGWGNKSDQSFYVMVTVGPDASVDSSAPGGVTTKGKGDIQSVSLAVDRTSYAGPCPVTLNFTGSIVAEGTGRLVYDLEAGSSTSGFKFYLPPPVTVNYTGVHYQPVYVSLDITSSVNGWARVHVSKPNSVRSDKVEFSIQCQ